MSKRTRRIEARVEVLEREVERLRELATVGDGGHSDHPWPGADDLMTGTTTVHSGDDKVTYTDPGLTSARCWRIEGKDVYCGGDATCS